VAEYGALTTTERGRADEAIAMLAVVFHDGRPCVAGRFGDCANLLEVKRARIAESGEEIAIRAGDIHLGRQ
jgi:hypothetical protein